MNVQNLVPSLFFLTFINGEDLSNGWGGNISWATSLESAYDQAFKENK